MLSHPEALFGEQCRAKGERSISGRKAPEAAFKTCKSREILRPEEGLRMTVTRFLWTKNSHYSRLTTGYSILDFVMHAS